MRVPELRLSTVERIVAAAAAAPSLHNSQPWRFRLRGDTVELRADPARTLKALDPGGREVSVACGAALLNLRVAVAAHGREPVTRLLPRRGQPIWLADVRIGGPRRVCPSDKALYAAISWRHTNRGPFEGREVPASLRSELAEAARMEGARLLFLCGSETQRVLDLVAEAELALQADPDYRAELSEWTNPDPARRDGIPLFAFGPPVADAALPLRDWVPGDAGRGRKKRYESLPQIAVLETRADTPADWLRAGQALQRVLLVATLHDVSASFLTQPLEREHLRREVHDPKQSEGHTQMIMRIGYPRHPATTVPRRNISDVFEVVSRP